MANTNSVQQNGWGGQWTEQKLDCFESYVRAYLTIMNVYRDKYKWKLIYFDGFAGCGGREQLAEQQEMQDLFGEGNVDSSELRLYQGAAERVVRLEQTMNGFDFYYFIDKYEDNLTRLELKLSAYETKGIKLFRPTDANTAALQLAEAMKKNSALKTLCFLDPFGMSVNWETITELAGKSIDLWILIPTGSIVNRLIQRNGELKYPERLEQFLGLPASEITNRMYRTDVEQTLFGEVQSVRKIDGAIEQLANIYCEQLGTLFPFVTSKPLALMNTHNVPIFHFACASYNQTAVKIAQQIINKRQR